MEITEKLDKVLLLLNDNYPLFKNEIKTKLTNTNISQAEVDVIISKLIKEGYAEIVLENQMTQVLKENPNPHYGVTSFSTEWEFKMIKVEKISITFEGKLLISSGSNNNDVVNPYPVIFKNGYAYNMFLELKKLTVKTNSIVADYSFIFHKMKNENIKAINNSVTEPKFIEFLNSTYNTDISVVKLPFKAPKYKEPIFTTVLDKFKGLL